MKTLLAVTAIAIATACTSNAGGWGFSLGNGAGFYFGNGNNNNWGGNCGGGGYYGQNQVIIQQTYVPPVVGYVQGASGWMNPVRAGGYYNNCRQPRVYVQNPW